MKQEIIIILSTILIALRAFCFDVTYSLDDPNYTVEENSFTKQGRDIKVFYVYRIDRTFVATIGLVPGYKDTEISEAHFTSLKNSLRKHGAADIKEKKKVTEFGLSGAKVSGSGQVEGKEIDVEGLILKDLDVELTIIKVAVNSTEQEADAAFEHILSGLKIIK